MGFSFFLGVGLAESAFWYVFSRLLVAATPRFGVLGFAFWRR